MITFERQQAILRLLREQPGIRVTQMANLLTVSRGTIRNDLLTLEEQKQVIRVRGGAVLANGGMSSANPSLLTNQVTSHTDAAKRRIARWAAELVEDGDAILLDASTTVQKMTPFLKDRRNLTIVTNGLDTARLLKQETDHTVILLGGVLLRGGKATGGWLNSDILDHLHIQTAFVSGAGFTKSAGITERTLEEAQLKQKMCGEANRTVALLDSSKIGKVGLTPFAHIQDLSHFLTDHDLPSDMVSHLRTAGVNLFVCGEQTVRSHASASDHAHFSLGFANESEALPFAVDVRRGLERAVASKNNIDLIITDNKLSGEEALRVADQLIARQVDLVIEYQIDYTVGGLIMDKFQRANIPVIAIDIPMVGATFFGIDNYRAGHVAGVALGEWIEAKWDGNYDHLLVLEELRAGSLPAARIQGQLDGMAQILGALPEAKLIFLDSGNTRSMSAVQVHQTLATLPNVHHIGVLSFNSDAALGALQAARDLGREQDIIVVGQGDDQLLRDEICKLNSRVIGTTAYMPARYGEQLLQLALKILHGESVPPAVYTEHVFINAGNINQYYP